jgi:FG-GAP-like repeat
MDMTRRQFALAPKAATYLRPSLFEPLSPWGKKLYHNNGNGTYTKVTETANVSGAGWSTSAALVDLDNDGLLDLVVLRYF